MKQIQHGFTLIELMIVVAIIGILAAIAIPAYRDYTARAYVTEGFSMASAVKASVSEYYATNGVFPTFNAEAGIANAPLHKGSAVDSISVRSIPVDKVSVITVYFNNKLDGKQLALVGTAASGAIAWRCEGESANNISGYVNDPIYDRWLPSNCR